MKNIQIIDGAENSTFSVFQATDEEFAAIFPKPDQDMAVIEDLSEYMSDELADKIFQEIWKRPILKRDAMGIHGTLFYHYSEFKHYLPDSRREVDYDESSINASQRALFAKHR